MEHIVPTTIVILIGAGVTALLARDTSAVNRKYLWLAFLAHVFGALVQIYLSYHVFKVADLKWYIYDGLVGAQHLSMNFMHTGYELLRVMAHQENNLPYRLIKASPATAALAAASAWIAFFTFSSKWAMSVFMGFFSMVGKYMIYKVFRDTFGKEHERGLIIAIMLMPSAVFWSSTLLKEGMATAGYGWLFWGMWVILYQRRWLAGIAAVVVGGAATLMVKPYIVFGLVAGIGAMAYARSILAQRVRPTFASLVIRAVVALVAVLFAIMQLGEIFPRFALENIAESGETLLEYGERATEGSSYSIQAGSGTLGAILFWPIGAFTACFRPFVWEAKNAQMLVAAMESTALFAVTLWILWRTGVKRFITGIFSSPVLLGSAVFVLIFATATGSVSTNFGTLARYRMPMIPFMAAILVMMLPASKARASAVVQSAKSAVKRKTAAVVSAWPDSSPSHARPATAPARRGRGHGHWPIPRDSEGQPIEPPASP